MVICTPAGGSYIPFGQYWNIFAGTYTVHIANVYEQFFVGDVKLRYIYDLHLFLYTSFSVQIAASYHQSIATRYIKFRNTM